MFQLLLDGYVNVFVLLFIASIISLTFHEFAHALTAKYYGDDTAQRAGRLSLNPIVHMHPLGLIIMIMAWFGFGKPVPTNTRNFSSPWAVPAVAAAGPAMNILLAVITINAYNYGVNAGITYLNGYGQKIFFIFLAQINFLFAIFNLIPLGMLDGHSILKYFLPDEKAKRYSEFNDLYGNIILLSLAAVSLLGLPLIQLLLDLSGTALSWFIFIPLDQTV